MKYVRQPRLRYDHLCVEKVTTVQSPGREEGRFKSLMLPESERRKLAGEDSDDDYSEDLYKDYLKKVHKEK